MATPSVPGLRPPVPKDATPPATPHTPRATNTPPPRATEATKPLHTVTHGAVSAAVFADSRDQATLNVSLRKSYRDGNGTWQHTHTLKAADLPTAIQALQECYEFAIESIKG